MATIKAEMRELTGKKAKRVSVDGMIPAVFYDSKTASHNIKVGKGDAIKLLRDATTTTIIDLDIDGTERKVIIKEVYFDPIYDEPMHIAFFELDEKAELNIAIPVVLKGISPAVKNNLGVLLTPTTAIEVKCTLANLVDEIVIDISGLTATGQTITIADIELPEGVALFHKDRTDLALVSIGDVQKTLETEDEEAAEAAGETVDAEEEEGVETEEVKAEEA